MTDHNYNDCDCVPGHRCDCWDYRSAGRGGEALITFRLKDFAERHGVRIEEDVA